MRQLQPKDDVASNPPDYADSLLSPPGFFRPHGCVCGFPGQSLHHHSFLGEPGLGEAQLPAVLLPPPLTAVHVWAHLPGHRASASLLPVRSSLHGGDAAAAPPRPAQEFAVVASCLPCQS